MDTQEEKIKKVLALFDEEDIKYINFDKLKVDDKEEKDDKKIKKLGGKNDRRTE